MSSSLRERVHALAAILGFDPVREQPDHRAQAAEAAAASAAAYEAHVAARRDAERTPVGGGVR